MEHVKPPPPPQEKQSSLEEKIEQLAEMQMEMQKSRQKFENETRTSLNNQATQLRNLEVQMGQMVHYSTRGNMTICRVPWKSTQGERV